MIRIIVDLVIVSGLALIAAFIYSMYFEPQMINHVYCALNTETDIGYTACRIANY